MQVKRLRDTYLVRLETGEEVIASLKSFASSYRIGFGALRAIGTFQRVTLGYYNTDTKSYQHKELKEPVEVLNMTGNISKGEDEQRIVHAHVTVGRSDYTTLGGHVVEAAVGPTVEVVIETAPTTIRRRHDPDTGLELWDLTRMETLSV
mgnify:FL=1